jgi:4-hydroxy-2-oxoglutarate aldolase
MVMSGVFAPVPTPMRADDGVDLERLRAVFPRWVASALAGFVVLGSNGEAVLLDEHESEQVIATAREVVPRGRPFIVGAGRESTRATIAAVRRAGELGADAVLVRTPGFFKAQMTAAAFVRHYTAVADASPVPVLLYNFTALTGVELPIDAVSALARHPNVAGMKESGGDLSRLAALAEAAGGRDFGLLAGSSLTFHGALRAGAVGGILALANVAPDACVRLYDLTTSGRLDEAARLQERLVPLGRLLGSVHGVAGLKAALEAAGCGVGNPRPPLLPLTGAGVAEIRAAVESLREVPA